jgi:hypothetical protein
VNENIGEMGWNCCAESVEKIKFVRRDKREKLYIACPSCGNSAAKGRTFQQTIKDNAVMYGNPETEYKGGGEPAVDSGGTAIQPNENPEGAEKAVSENSEEIPETKTPAAPESPPEKVLTADEIYNLEMD